ncbi:cytochrome c family protein [bacterium]|nr:cytochrome c family protein [bacterium]
MKKTIQGLFLAGISLLFTQASLATDGGRTELEGPGDAEVIAGTGYQHTLFDSADNKCQHCHNDLYDTWKTSMHAKSWADPLFQIKYQDFLRLQASKIGAEGATVDGVKQVYKEDTIQKTAQVCIKCHAPAAYYSGDYKVELKRVGGDHENTDYDPEASYDLAKAMEANLSNPPSDPPKPKYNPAQAATVAALAQTGQAYTVMYHIGNSHNREGVNCAFCHSIETVRMFSEDDGSDGGEYTLKGPIKMGPIGPIVREAEDTLHYSANADALDMNAFFALIGPEKYADVGNTPKVKGDFDDDKTADGRFTMKSTVPTPGCDKNHEGPCESEDFDDRYYTGGPFYGPFGITGLSNSRDDDLSQRELLVKDEFRNAVGEHPDKFEDKHQFAAYGKALCLSCHQRSSLMLNPESNGVPGVQPDSDQFLELCSTWTAMSDGIGDNYTDTEESPKCQRCHMEPLNKIKGERVTVLHQWDQPDVLFTKDDEEYLTAPFDPDSGYGPVAEGYLNNHAFMGANTADFGTTKIKTGFKAGLDAKKDDGKIVVETALQNMTAHMFPGAHPIRRVLTRVVVTDANGNMIPFQSATGKSKYKSIKNKVAVLDGNKIKPGFKKVDVKYDENRNIVIQGYTPDLDEYGEPVTSQIMDQSSVPWASPDGTVAGGIPTQVPDPKNPGETIWVIKGTTTVKKIIEDTNTDYFTRIYGRETGKRITDMNSPDYLTHVVRPGFDSNIAADNRLKPNEKEKYRITYDTSDVEAWPVTVKYKVYFMKKGAGGVFPTDTATGFLNANLPAWKKKKLAIFEVASKEVVVAGKRGNGHGHGRGKKDDD